MASSKRKHGEDSPPSLYSNKSRSRSLVETRIDPTYGQRSAIPGLDSNTVNIGDDDDCYDRDALAYLRAVRQEATGIPNLLTAPKSPSNADENRQLYLDEVDNFRGWYEDGAYVASCIAEPEESSRVAEPTTQVLYFNSIMARYLVLRAQLQQEPPSDLVANLGQSQRTYVGPLNRNVSRWWIGNMKKSDPSPVQVACMNKNTVLRLLGLLTTPNALKVGSKVEVTLSRWAWSLLARLPDQGSLTSEEIGVVRELGKKAVLFGAKLREYQEYAASLLEVQHVCLNLDDEGLPLVNEDEIPLELDPAFPDPTESQLLDTDSEVPITQRGQAVEADVKPNRITEVSPATHKLTAEIIDKADGPSANLEEARARVLQRLSETDAAAPSDSHLVEQEHINTPEAELPGTPSVDDNTQATVDMILTIAGEGYGQRDLLPFRGT